MVRRVAQDPPAEGLHAGSDGKLIHLRRWLLVVFVAGTLGTAIELLLAGHVEERRQLIPLALCALSLVVLAWHKARGGRASLGAFRIVMALFVASALVGLWFHYEGNVEFELEKSPDLAGWTLFWSAVRGVSPPSLAPGTMAVLGTLGLLWSHRHDRGGRVRESQTKRTGAKE